MLFVNISKTIRDIFLIVSAPCWCVLTKSCTTFWIHKFWNLFLRKMRLKKNILVRKITKTTLHFSWFFLVPTEEFVRNTTYCSGYVKSKIYPVNNFLAFLREKTLLWKMQISCFSCFCILHDMFLIFFLRIPSTLARTVPKTSPLKKLCFFILRSLLSCTFCAEALSNLKI